MQREHGWPGVDSIAILLCVIGIASCGSGGSAGSSPAQAGAGNSAGGDPLGGNAGSAHHAGAGAGGASGSGGSNGCTSQCAGAAGADASGTTDDGWTYYPAYTNQSVLGIRQYQPELFSLIQTQSG